MQPSRSLLQQLLTRLAVSLVILGAGAACAPFKEFVGLEPKVDVRVGPETGEQMTAESGYHFLRAEFLTQNADFPEALEEYKLALENDPRSSYLGLKVAMAHLTVGDVPGAEKAVKQVLSYASGNAQAHFLMGKLYYQTGRENMALDEFKEAARLEPENLEMLLFHGLLLAEHMRFDEAIPVLERILQIRPDVDIVYFSLGKIYAVRKEWDKAEAFFIRTLQINPGFKAAYAELLRLYETTQQQDKMIVLYKRLLETVDPSNVELRARLADIFVRQERLDEARDLYEEIRKDDPLNPQVTTRLGLIYFQQERYADAVAQFQLYLAGDPGNDAVRYYLALSYEKLGKRKEAREILQQIGKDSKIYLDAVYYLAYLDEQDEKMDAAIQRLRDVLILFPDDIRGYRILADTLRRAKRTDESIAVLEKTLEKVPNDTELLFALGVAYDQKGDYERTIATMQKVIELDPNHAHALNYLGYTWADKGVNLEEAEKLIRRALELKPGDGYITDSLAWVFFRRGHIKEALATQEEAVRLAPEDAQIVEHLGEIYEAAGKLEKAMAAFEQALSLAKPDDEKLKKDIEERIRKLRKKMKHS